MFTDVVGYTALTQRNEADTIRLLEEHRKLIRPIFASHGGHEIKTVGDAFLVEFQSALDALLCSVAIQQTMHDRMVARGDELSLRIGIHVGDVMERANDILGDAVNIASRIEPLAEPGGICISGQVYDQVRNKSDLPFDPLGEKPLKNVSNPVAVYAVRVPWKQSATFMTPELAIKRIAVLPLANLSSDPEEGYFADGMTEEIITSLSGVRQLTVIARTSVMGYKNTTKKVKEIANELGVGSILEGSVRKAGNRVRITAQLIDAATEGHIWAQNYDRQLEDVFAIQSEIAEKVAGELKVRLVNEEKQAIEKKATVNTEAYTLFLQATRLVTEQEEAPLLDALSLFEEALAKDPSYARAYAGLADCYQKLGNSGYIKWSEAIEKGRAAAMKALEIDPDLAEAHLGLAMIMFMDDENPVDRQSELRKALGRNPNLADAYWQLAQEAGSTGDREEMVRAGEKAYQLDPLSPDEIRLLGIAYLYAERDADLLNHAKKTIHLNPYGTHRYLFDFYLSKGDYEKAENELREMERIGPTLEYTYLNRGYLAAIRGDAGTAREMIDKLDSTHNPGWARSSSAGIIHLALGNTDKFFEYMSRAAEDGTLPVTTLRFNPLVAKAREDPRFPELLRKVGKTVQP